MIDLASLCNSDDGIRDKSFHLNISQTLGGGIQSNLLDSNAADREELAALDERGFSAVVEPATLFDDQICQERDWLATKSRLGELELFVTRLRDGLKKIGKDSGCVRKWELLIHPS